MKRLLIYLLAFVVVFSALPIVFITGKSKLNATTPSDNMSTTSKSESQPQISSSVDEQSSSSSTPPETEAPIVSDGSITLYDIATGGNISVPYLDYMIGAVAAEMPADFEIEAMKAQALASLSYALYYSENYPNQSLTCDTENNKGYMDRDAMSNFWGIRYMEYYLKISAGCNEILGEAILYNGEPIAAAYHASSALATASSEQVWTSSLPYLRSVASVEPSDIKTTALTTDEVVQILSADNETAAFPNDIKSLFSDVYYFENGYIDTIKIAGKLYTGEQLRTLFSLRSSAVTITYENNSFTFATTGYGHGVGLSQEGAQFLAQNGYNYKEILQYYYTDVSIENYY